MFASESRSLPLLLRLVTRVAVGESKFPAKCAILLARRPHGSRGIAEVAARTASSSPCLRYKPTTVNERYCEYDNWIACNVRSELERQSADIDSGLNRLPVEPNFLDETRSRRSKHPRVTRLNQSTFEAVIFSVGTEAGRRRARNLFSLFSHYLCAGRLSCIS